MRYESHQVQQSRDAFKTYTCNLQTWQALKWSYSRLVGCTHVGPMQKIRSRIEFSLKNNWDPCNSSSLYTANTKITLQKSYHYYNANQTKTTIPCALTLNLSTHYPCGAYIYEHSVSFYGNTPRLRRACTLSSK